MRRAFAALVGLAMFSAVSIAQTSTGTTTQPSGRLGADLGENTPAENVRVGKVSERAPARIVDLARLRHTGLAAQRLGAQRDRDMSDLAPEDGAIGGGATSGLGGLIDNLLGSGLLGALGGGGLDVGGLLGGLGGTGATGTSGLPPEVLMMLQGAGIDINDVLTQKTRSDATPVAADKSADRQQSTNPPTTQPEFRVRWANAMLTAFFTAVVAGLGTQDFVDTIADLFAPIFRPPANNGDTGNGDNNPGDGDNGGDDDTGDGDPII